MELNFPPILGPTRPVSATLSSICKLVWVDLCLPFIHDSFSMMTKMIDNAKPLFWLRFGWIAKRREQFLTHFPQPLVATYQSLATAWEFAYQGCSHTLAWLRNQLWTPLWWWVSAYEPLLFIRHQDHSLTNTPQIDYKDPAGQAKVGNWERSWVDIEGLDWKSR